MRQTTIAIILLALLNLPAAAAVHYVSGLEAAAWEAGEGEGECSLTHAVPRHGRAIFTRADGRGLSLLYITELPLVEGTAAALYALPTGWSGTDGGEELGAVWLEPGVEPLTIGPPLAQRIWRELEQGRMIRLEYVSHRENGGPVTIDLLPLRFRAATASFLACAAGLISLDFEPATEWRIPFATGKSRPDRGQEEELARIAAAVAAEPGEVRLVIGGHADARGGEEINRRLAGARAEAVRDRLVELGVPATAVSTVNFGTDWPLATGEGAEAWRENRRATVWLVR